MESALPLLGRQLKIASAIYGRSLISPPQAFLGSAKVFGGYAKQANKETLAAERTRFMVALRKLTQPYILRRLKSDKSIIADLPS